MLTILLLGLTLTVEPAAPEVTLGAPIELKLTLKNDGKAPHTGPALKLDERSVQLTIGEGAKQFVYSRKNDEAPAAETLAPGASWSGTVSFMPVRAGNYPIEASYMGKASAETKVAVKPGKDGASELAILMSTDKGDMKIRFFPEVAPNHVAHFAERVAKGFYNGLTLHRVIQKFMSQGGDPDGTGGGGPGYQIRSEFTRDPKYSHTFGRLSTARTRDPHSAGSQFFLCFDEATFLDGQYTVLGEVFEGQETLRKIEAIGVPPKTEGKPKEIVKITTATLVPVKAGS